MPKKTASPAEDSGPSKLVVLVSLGTVTLLSVLIYVAYERLWQIPPDVRNEPAMLSHLLTSVASALHRPAEDVAADTTAAARSFFALEE